MPRQFSPAQFLPKMTYAQRKWLKVATMKKNCENEKSLKCRINIDR